MAAAGRELLVRAWQSPPTIRGWLGAVNHKQVGLRFVVTALGFFLIAGLDSTVIRAQLAVPESELVEPDIFNQLFTTHGTAMMFLFAVPMVEGIAIYLLPLMIGARDMAFPRLNAFGYWLYLFGGLLLYASTLPDIVNFLWPGGELLPSVVPDGGWFAYPPLTSSTFSPGPGLDIWLIAVTLAEISALIAAVELIVTTLKLRAPGMTAMRMPLFAWSVLMMAFAILFAFPAVVLASTFLELERSVGMPFYDPTRGGDPILWQHLFWIFGHPEVYIMFIPATGIASMVLATFAGRPIVGYLLIVAALVATAVLSFGLWVHHMFATGLPWLGLAYFAAASMMITLPSGVQVFAWLATLLKAPRIRLTTPMLFVIGFLVTFVLGGITGVMVASVPFDLQSHDTYFVVAHFHYVLVGGVVLPIFAGLWYWFPKLSGRVLSERLGRWFFWLFFVGLNVTFLPQHQLGLLGMRRRVYTFESETWMNVFNLLSSAGVLFMIAGVGVFAAAVALALWRSAPDAGADPWHGRSLEWAVASPPPVYNFATIPAIRSLEPVRGRDSAAAEVDRLPAGLEGDPPASLPRETLGTGALDAEPESVVPLPSNSLVPLWAALALTAAGAAVVVRLYPLAGVGVLAAVALLVIWGLDRSAEPDLPGRGRSLPAGLPVHAAGARSTVWWGGVLGTAAAATFFADAVFAHLYLAYKAETWPPAGASLPDPLPGGVAVAAAIVAAVAAVLARRANARSAASRLHWALETTLALGLGYAALQVWGLVAGAPPPDASGYAAVAWALSAFPVAAAAVGMLLSGVLLGRAVRGRSDSRRGAAIEVAAVWWAFTAVAALVAYGAVHLAPRLFA